MNEHDLKHIIEATLLAAGKPITTQQLMDLFEERERPTPEFFTTAIGMLIADYENRGIELVEVASGWRIQVRPKAAEVVSRLWSERPAKYSRAFLETLALIAYRQPITRSEIEEIRGVSISSTIMRTLQERGWIRTVGHREVPGRPELLGTTREFLDYFGLKSLDQLPTLAELKDIESIGVQLELPADQPQASIEEGAPEGEVAASAEEGVATGEAAADGETTPESAGEVVASAEAQAGADVEAAAEADADSASEIVAQADADNGGEEDAADGEEDDEDADDDLEDDDSDEDDDLDDEDDDDFDDEDEDEDESDEDDEDDDSDEDDDDLDDDDFDDEDEDDEDDKLSASVDGDESDLDKKLSAGAGADGDPSNDDEERARVGEPPVEG